MTHRLTNNYAKNYCNRTLIVKVIAENIVTFFWDTVYIDNNDTQNDIHKISTASPLVYNNMG